jgi:hypothetical protein
VQRWGSAAATVGPQQRPGGSERGQQNRTAQVAKSASKRPGETRNRTVGSRGRKRPYVVCETTAYSEVRIAVKKVRKRPVSVSLNHYIHWPVLLEPEIFRKQLKSPVAKSYYQPK